LRNPRKINKNFSKNGSRSEVALKGPKGLKNDFTLSKGSKMALSRKKRL